MTNNGFGRTRFARRDLNLEAIAQLDLRRIGDRRADEIIDALLRLAIERYLETYEVEPDEAVERNCHAYAGEDRAWLAEQATRNLKDALHARAKVRREEAAYQAAACITALREKAPT